MFFIPISSIDYEYAFSDHVVFALALHSNVFVPVAIYSHTDGPLSSVKPDFY